MAGHLALENRTEFSWLRKDAEKSSEPEERGGSVLVNRTTNVTLKTEKVQRKVNLGILWQ